MEDLVRVVNQGPLSAKVTETQSAVGNRVIDPVFLAILSGSSRRLPQLWRLKPRLFVICARTRPLSACDKCDSSLDVASFDDQLSVAVVTTVTASLVAVSRTCRMLVNRSVESTLAHIVHCRPRSVCCTETVSAVRTADPRGISKSEHFSGVEPGQNGPRLRRQDLSAPWDSLVDW